MNIQEPKEVSSGGSLAVGIQIAEGRAMRFFALQIVMFHPGGAVFFVLKMKWPCRSACLAMGRFDQDGEWSSFQRGSASRSAAGLLQSRQVYLHGLLCAEHIERL